MYADLYPYVHKIVSVGPITIVRPKANRVFNKISIFLSIQTQFCNNMKFTNVKHKFASNQSEICAIVVCGSIFHTEIFTLYIYHNRSHLHHVYEF